MIHNKPSATSPKPWQSVLQGPSVQSKCLPQWKWENQKDHFKYNELLNSPK